MKIAIFAHHSLFTDGIASQLAERPSVCETCFVDASQPDAFEQLVALAPDIILVNTTDMPVGEKYLCARLLENLSQSIIMQLSYESETVKIFSSEQRMANQINDLIAIIRDLNPVSGKTIDA